MSTAVDLFLASFKIGALSFGGAYSFLPLIEREVVTNHGWLTQREFLSVLGAVQTFPGAISIKYATYVGHKQSGVLGALIANVANLLPPAILIFSFSAVYRKYGDVAAVKKSLEAVRFAALGLLAAMLFQFLTKTPVSIAGAVFALGACAAVVFFRVHPAWVILGAIVLGATRALLSFG